MKPIVFASFVLFLFLSEIVKSNNDADEIVTVDGWAVHGFSQGKQIGYEWADSEEKAKAIKSAWEKITVAKRGKYYDDVKIDAEPGQIQISALLAPAPARDNTSILEKIKAYKESLSKSYDRIKNLERILESKPGRAEATQIDALNKVIGSYNNRRESYITETGDRFADVPPLKPFRNLAITKPTMTTIDVGSKRDMTGLEGTWEISTSGGHGTVYWDGKLTTTFNADGTMTRATNGHTYNDYTWTRDKNTINVQSGKYTFHGTMRGDQIDGTAAYDGKPFKQPWRRVK